MAAEQSRQDAALAAGWRPHPRFSRENLAVKWQFPQLSLRIWAELDGMHLYAIIETLDEKGRLKHDVIAEAAWQPSDVTEARVVDWGRRALAKYLEGGLKPSKA